MALIPWDKIKERLAERFKERPLVQMVLELIGVLNSDLEREAKVDEVQRIANEIVDHIQSLDDPHIEPVDLTRADAYDELEKVTPIPEEEPE